MDQLTLRYGCNPHQKPARIYAAQGRLPIVVLNGTPGYINLCDALNSWQLVKELRTVLGMPAAASFKHVSPAGAAIGLPMSGDVTRASCVDDMELSPLAIAYARARGADRMSSFGDWAALSDVVDVPTATLIKREVSDGVIAPGFTPEALAILREKKKGGYAIIQIDPDYQPPEIETREIYGVIFEQRRNGYLPDESLFDQVVTASKELPATARRDAFIAQICLKYTQSNSVCYAFDGQVIGVGAGQQSRVHCTRLAGAKADRWFLRQHPDVLGCSFKPGITRAQQNNAIDKFLEDDLAEAELRQLESLFIAMPQRFSPLKKREWLNRQHGVVLASDAFFPFRDNIDRARQSGVSYVVQPGGSVHDAEVVQACDEYGMVMVHTGVRLFHH